MDSSVLLRDVPIEMFEGKNVLLTGATGLVGSHFLRAFKEMHDRGVTFNVTAVGYNYPMDYIGEILNQPWVTFTMMNLATANIKPYFKDMDIIIHGATYGQPRKFIGHSDDTIMLNTSTVVELISKLHEDGKFLFISSSEVYSGLDELLTEDKIGTTTPSHPRACYIESKKCGEAIVNNYRESGLDAKSVRLSLAYGEGVRKDDDRVMSVFIRKALESGKIKMLDNGDAIRTYLYVEDAVNMMLRVLLEGKQNVYNIGGLNATTIKCLAEDIGYLLNVPVIPSGLPKLEGSPTNVFMSMERYTKEFGQREFIPLNEGLKRTINYFKSLYK